MTRAWVGFLHLPQIILVVRLEGLDQGGTGNLSINPDKQPMIAIRLVSKLDKLEPADLADLDLPGLAI